eukprot:3195742-Ditylum_brightwellii.AAC.1
MVVKMKMIFMIHPWNKSSANSMARMVLTNLQMKLLETHCIRNKPIREGYKLFALSTTMGFAVNSTPDGKTAAKSKQQKYKTLQSGKIESMILYVVSIISHLCDKQKP